MKIRKVYILGLLFGAFCFGACSDDEVHTGISGEEAQPFLRGIQRKNGCESPGYGCSQYVAADQGGI